MEEIESFILKALENGTEVFSTDVADTKQCSHQDVVGAGKSLEADGYLLSNIISREVWKFSPEALSIMEKGSPEYRLWALLDKGPLSQAEAEEKLGGKDVMAVALSNGMKAKRLEVKREKGKEKKKTSTKTPEKAPSEEKVSKIASGKGTVSSSDRAISTAAAVTVSRAEPKAGESAEWSDTVCDLLKALYCSTEAGKHQKTSSTAPPMRVDSKDVEMLKKRKLAQLEEVKVFCYTRGPQYALERRGKAATDLTREMLQDGSWETTAFKMYNFNAKGIETSGGQLHPLLKVRQEFREIFAELGFQEMNTQQWVSSSFWNFDSLLIPQHHPSRDLQDTFFVSKPRKADLSTYDQKLIEKVKQEHERCFLSSWSEEESAATVLRTHTTGSSAYVLYKLYQDTLKSGTFRPGRYFSIDRVFRNEEMDRTHLCEFHQVEGFVIDRGISLAKMMHTFRYFFHRIGIVKLRFKPAFNPYTEPSMEIFGYHDKCGMWMEVGNSGLFRPELLKSLGFGEDIAVMAWGLSLERPTMIKYGIKNINQLFGHRVNLKFIKQAPLARF